jgi:GT2 family glycosyltransferase/glycosyltransferase involved in cell wall biosynthesis
MAPSGESSEVGLPRQAGEDRARAVDVRGYAAVCAAQRAAIDVAGALSMQWRHAADALAGAPPTEQQLYDLIIPAYNAPEVLQRCLDTLLAQTHPRHPVHVIDDASPDPGIGELVRRYAAVHPQVHYHRLEINRGFPGAVNAGIALTAHDVVVINADTEFPPGWLARLDRCRRSDPAIHAVSPLSNNAGPCSVPSVNEPNAHPAELSVEAMDALVQRTSLRRYPRVPTVVGFCMLLTRRAIDDVGVFDPVFGRGYAEEVDWCQRAWARGYESAICDDLYVYHRGEVSFSQVPQAQALRQHNERLLGERWPAYAAAAQGYSARNPLRCQQQRIFEALRREPPDKLRVLHVTRSFDVPAQSRNAARLVVDALPASIVSTVLYPASLPSAQDGVARMERAPGGRERLEVRLNAGGLGVDHALRGAALMLRSEQAEHFFADVMGGTGASVVEFSHFANLGSLALPLVAKALGAKVVVSLQDFFLLCPDWNLMHANGEPCNEPRASPDNARCIECLGRRIRSREGCAPIDLPRFLAERAALADAVLESADAIVAPSAFVRAQFVRACGAAMGERIRVIAHGTHARSTDAAHRPAAELRVVYVGPPGARRFAETFALVTRRLRGAAVRCTMLDRVDSATATDVPGETTDAAERERRLAQADIVVAGVAANEVHSHAIDEAFCAGAPVIAPAIGAAPERIVAGETGLLVPAGDADALAAAILQLDADRARVAAMRRQVAALSLWSIGAAAAEHARLYAALVAQSSDHDATRTAMRSGVG